MEINIADNLQQISALVVAAAGGAILGWKRLQKSYARDDLDTTRANTESNVINLIYTRLTELEQINKGLMVELETLREENLESKMQNREMRVEIQKLRQYIESNFTPTYS